MIVSLSWFHPELSRRGRKDSQFFLNSFVCGDPTVARVAQ